MGHVVVLVGGFMVTITEDRQRRLGLGGREMRFPRRFSRNRQLRQGQACLWHGIKVRFLFQRTDTALAMATATAVKGVLCIFRSELGELKSTAEP